MSETPQSNGIPRGALIVVAIGLFACVAAAALATDTGGTAAQLEWVQEEPLPASAPVEIPGGNGEQMRLEEGWLRSTGTNAGGYALYGVASTLRIDAGAPVGGGRILCRTRGAGLVAQTPKLRATYPRSSEKLEAQSTIEVVLVEYNAKAAGLAVVDVADRFEDGFTTEDGIKVEWPEYRDSDERIKWFLPPGPPTEDLVLPFATIWKTAKVPGTRVSCTLTTSAGAATVRTHARLPERSPLIDEDAEALAQEAEEAAEASEEAE